MADITHKNVDSQPGYRVLTRKPAQDRDHPPRRLLTTLLGADDQFAVLAEGSEIGLYPFDDFGDGATRPVARGKMGGQAQALIPGGRRAPMSLYVLDDAGQLFLGDFTGRDGQPSSAELLPIRTGIKAPIQRVVVLRKRVILLTGTDGAVVLHALDRRSGKVQELGTLPLDVDLSALDADRHDILIGRDKGEVRLILPGDATGRPEIHPFGVERVTAATILDGSYLVLAQKGGGLRKLDLRSAAVPEMASKADPTERLCHVLRTLLKTCGCDCGCKDGHDPDGRDPGRKPLDDEPCGDRHRARLGFTVHRLARAGGHLVALSQGATRMAILDDRLNVLTERKLDREGALISAGQTQGQNLLVHVPRKNRIEALQLAEFARGLRPRLPEGLVPKPMPKQKSVSYWGMTDAPAAPNPTIRVCLFPVIDPGQTFNDADMSRLVAQIEAKSFDRVNDYYDENSFGEASYEFSVFGHDIGGTRRPLVLPQLVRNYFWDGYRGGGLRVQMPGDWTNPVVFDGTEALTILARPRAGAQHSYAVPFAAMWTRASHGTYPLTVNFTGTETVQLAVVTPAGASHNLTLNFSALNLTLNQSGDHAAFLAALGAHVTAAIRAAEATLPGAPRLIEDVAYRQYRTSGDLTQFGRLLGQFRSVTQGGATQKGRISVATPMGGGVTQIGLTSFGETPGEMTGVGRVSTYISHCLCAAQIDAGEGIGAGNPYFATTPGTTYDAVAQTVAVTISLNVDFGGERAQIEVQSSSGLNGTGWNDAEPDPGSESNPNNANALRYSTELADDCFTAACQSVRDRGMWVRLAVAQWFQNFDVMMITHVGAPHPGIPASEAWSCDEPADFAGKRMYKRVHFATDKAPPPGEDPIQFGSSAITGQNYTNIGSADMNHTTSIMVHELGHALGLPDLYSANGYRDDVLYVDPYCMMAGDNSTYHHLCGWAKWSLGWIPDMPGNANVNRTIFVDLPDASNTLVREAWLVPVEYWDDAMRQDVRDAVGGSVEIGQLVKLNLGSDGGVTAFLELRARGFDFSHNLSPQPTIYATNGLDPASDREWAVNGLYRRHAHRLNAGTELRNVGDVWDFAKGAEFPIKGTTVRIEQQETIRGTIPVWRVRVERKQAEFIDLHFQDHVPSWRSPDIWVDWPGDNPDPNVPRDYPVGMPVNQGETVRYPSGGTERHFVVARVHNAGNVRAESVKVRWFLCDPPGAGDDGRWVDRGTRTLPLVSDGDHALAVFDWNVDSSTNSHQCMRMEIIDWTVPNGVDPATGDTVALASDDVRLQNNIAQKNVFDFEAVSGSPFDPVTFRMQVHNDRSMTEIAALVPEGLRDGMRLTISPAEWAIPSGEARIFTCTLQLDHDLIRPGCDNDSGFLLTAWRRGGEADARWGSCFYHIRPRFRTALKLLRGGWHEGRLVLYGQLDPLTDAPLDLAQDMPLFARIRLQFDGETGPVSWRTVQIGPDGSFVLDTQQKDGKTVVAQAWFDRTDRLGSAVSNEWKMPRTFTVIH